MGGSQNVDNDGLGGTRNYLSVEMRKYVAPEQI